MERLLTRAETDTHIIYTIGHGRFRVDKRETSALRRVFDRLAAYEDTELTPEEIESVLDKYGRRFTAKTAFMDELKAYRAIGTVEGLSALVKARAEAEAALGGGGDG